MRETLFNLDLNIFDCQYFDIENKTLEAPLKNLTCEMISLFESERRFCVFINIFSKQSCHLL